MENNRFHSASFCKALSPWLFMLPGIIFTVWLRYYPIIKSFYMSLFSYDAVNPPGHFAGFQNYINLFTRDKLFLKSLFNGKIRLFS